MMSFDFQTRYIDCPTEIDVMGTPTTVGRGLQVIISKQYDWYMTSAQYASGDRLSGNNGTLAYTVTNA
jgi:hypothetical protein